MVQPARILEHQHSGSRSPRTDPILLKRGYTVGPSFPQTRLVDLARIPGAPAGANFAGIARRVADGSEAILQVRLRARVDGNNRVLGIEAVGPQVSLNGRVISSSNRVYIIADRHKRLITDPREAMERARQLLTHHNITDPAWAQLLKVGFTSYANGTRLVDLSSVPGAPAGVNYAGVQYGDTVMQVRLQARVDGAGRAVSIQAVGPEITQNGQLISRRTKVYELKDSSGNRITDPVKAILRARELIQYEAITKQTARQRQTVEDNRAKRPAPPIVPGVVQFKAPGIEYSNNPNVPNRFIGPAPDIQRVSRTKFNVGWETQSAKATTTLSAMIVPNVVFEVGPKKKAGAPATGRGVTVQPMTMFIPVSGGGPGYATESQNRALVRSTLHPAGFYPGDGDWARWSAYLRDDPTRAPQWRETNWGYSSKITTKNWWQVYWNSPFALQPWVGGSVNGRYIARRDEVRLGLFSMKDNINSVDHNSLLATLYSWIQPHLKGGGANIAQAARAPYATIGIQGEVGGYVWLTSSPAPFTGKIKKELQDWHIVNGSITSDRRAFLDQFATARNRAGLRMLSESVVPTWQDRSAAVFVEAPLDARAPSARWSETMQKHLVQINGTSYITAQGMAALLNQLGREDPAYKEMRWIDARTIHRLNQGNLVKVKDPRTGKEAAMFRAGTWINTGARVAVGGPGLFLPDDVGVRPAR